MAVSPRLAALAVIGGAALLLPTVGSAAPTPLKGKVGPGFTITLKKGGVAVTKLTAGKYKVTVNDASTFHNFHLTGPGVDKVITTIPGTGLKTAQVTLAKGTYTYLCDAHPTQMIKTFTVK